MLALYYPGTYQKIEYLEKEKKQKIKKKLFSLARFVGQKWSLPGLLISTFEGSPAAKEENHPAKYAEIINGAVRLCSFGQKEHAIEVLERNFQMEGEEIRGHLAKAFDITRELYGPLLKDFKESFPSKASPERQEISNEGLFQKAIQEITSNLVSQADFKYILSMVCETLIRVFHCETVLFGLCNQDQKAVVIRYALGKNRKAWKNFTFPLNGTIKKLFHKQVEWTCSGKNIPELWASPREAEKDVLISPLVLSSCPIGLIFAIREHSFSGEELAKIEILKNLLLLSLKR
ncbi:hypothetical protein TH606_11010 [Thermodesulfatator autotrophicus]|uniref:GAF domain-containing protein n=2 Tax=Thermodesulfatator autotrophicus TaxID=1795632 RepID=A0A177E4G8_9BACT|nr:hypothetical protein TH606_11010 [Thermodesulfatator autotrophicus]